MTKVVVAMSMSLDGIAGPQSADADGMAIFKQMKELDFNAKFYYFIRAPDGLAWPQNLGKDGDYHTIEVGFVRFDATFQFRWTLGAPGTHTFRARITSDENNVRATSAPVWLSSTSTKLSARWVTSP